MMMMNNDVLADSRSGGVLARSGLDTGVPSSRPSSPQPAERRLLLVDDELTLLRSIGRVMRSKGYVVETAASGEEAVAKMSDGTWDAVLSDISMPGIDGIELLRIARAQDVELPVILVTGEPTVGTAVKALELGAFHYLTKPVDMGELDAAIDKAVCVRRMGLMKRQAAELLGGDQSDELQALHNSFSSALDSLWMAYQPIVSARDSRVYGYEALLRSNEPSLPHPGAVLEAAERLGTLTELGRTIRARAAEPVSLDPTCGKLFVNLHTDDLGDPALLDRAAPLSKIADRVVLEITERASLQRVSDVRGRIAALREIGFQIAVDDLGAGYAGLTSFAQLEPEIVKLDMSLVRDVHLSATKQKLIRSMTALCKDMGMLVVGEGVENAEERDALCALGCDLLQGYFFAKPGKPFPEVSC